MSASPLTASLESKRGENKENLYIHGAEILKIKKQNKNE